MGVRAREKEDEWGTQTLTNEHGQVSYMPFK